MIAEKLPTKEDLWEEIRERLITKTARVLCSDEHDPFRVKAARERAIKLADQVLTVIFDHAGGRNVYIPRLPSFRRELRDLQLRLDFNGANHAQIGAHARYRPICSRQVRRILDGK